MGQWSSCSAFFKTVWFGLPANAACLMPLGLCPSTGMTKLGPSQEGQVQDLITSTIPVGRMGSKWDIAMTCVFLSTQAAG